MIPDYKFAFVSICFIVALFSYAKCYSKKEWGLLTCGLGFTVLADYFLVMRNDHLFGVAAFCFTHVCYILRAVEFNKRIVFQICVFSIFWVFALAANSVVVLAGLYACLFAFNIYLNAKTRRPKWNYCLVMAGLVLFALCDINVMLFNLSRYTSVSQVFSASFVLIWVFYLPSQALLAVSALKVCS